MTDRASCQEKITSLCAARRNIDQKNAMARAAAGIAARACPDVVDVNAGRPGKNQSADDKRVRGHRGIQRSVEIDVPAADIVAHVETVTRCGVCAGHVDHAARSIGKITGDHRIVCAGAAGDQGRCRVNGDIAGELQAVGGVKY